jgi:hypothetical protein
LVLSDALEGVDNHRKGAKRRKAVESEKEISTHILHSHFDSKSKILQEPLSVPGDGWNESELKNFLEENRLYRLMPIFWPPKFKMNPQLNEKNLETVMFEKSVSSRTMELVKAPLECLIDLLLLHYKGIILLQ